MDSLDVALDQLKRVVQLKLEQKLRNFVETPNEEEIKHTPSRWLALFGFRFR